MLADLDLVLGMFRRSGRPILGTLGASGGQVRVDFGGREEQKGAVVENQKYGKTQEKRKKLRQILDRLCQGVPDLGWCSGRGPKWATWVYPNFKFGSK